jgi:hypothetical protein
MYSNPGYEVRKVDLGAREHQRFCAQQRRAIQYGAYRQFGRRAFPQCSPNANDQGRLRVSFRHFISVQSLDRRDMESI